MHLGFASPKRLDTQKWRGKNETIDTFSKARHFAYLCQLSGVLPNIHVNAIYFGKYDTTQYKMGYPCLSSL